MTRSRAIPGSPPRVAAALLHDRTTSSIPSGVPSEKHATFHAPLQASKRHHCMNFETSSSPANCPSMPGPRRRCPAGTPSRQPSCLRKSRNRPSPVCVMGRRHGRDRPRRPSSAVRTVPPGLGASTPRQSVQQLSTEGLYLCRLADAVMTEIPGSPSWQRRRRTVGGAAQGAACASGLAGGGDHGRDARCVDQLMTGQAMKPSCGIQRRPGLSSRQAERDIRHSRGVKALSDAGLNERQAEAITATVRDAVSEGVASKADIADVRCEPTSPLLRRG